MQFRLSMTKKKGLKEPRAKGPNYSKNKYKNMKQKEKKAAKKEEDAQVIQNIALLTKLETARAIDTTPGPGKSRPKPTDNNTPQSYFVHSIRKACEEVVDSHFSPKIENVSEIPISSNTESQCPATPPSNRDFGDPESP